MPDKVVSWVVYLVVFLGLLALTALTYLVSCIDLSRWNLVIALAIAVSKAVLVCLFFMHAFYSSRLTRIIIVSGLFWLAIMIVLSLGDYLTRGWVL